MRARQPPTEFLTVCALTLFGMALRLIFLAQPMRLDEAMSFTEFASKPLWAVVSYYWAPNNQIFHTLLMHIAYVIFGNEERWLRLPTLFAGLLTIPATYRVGRRFYDGRVGLLAAALVASSSLLIEYSTNARGYTLIVLFFLLLLDLAKTLKTRSNPRLWALFGLFTVLGFYTIPVMLYPFLLVAGWLVMSIWQENRGAQRWRLYRHLVVTLVIAGIVTVLLYVPPAIYLATTTETRRDFYLLDRLTWIEWFESMIGDTLQFLVLWWVRDLPIPVIAVLIVGLFAGLKAHRKIARYRRSLITAGLIFITPFVVIQQMMIVDRVWLFMLPLCMIIACAGLVYLLRLGKRPVFWTAIAALVTAVGLGLIVANSRAIFESPLTGSLPDARQVAAYLAKELHPDDMVLCHRLCDITIQYYAEKDGLPLDMKQFHRLEPPEPPRRAYILLHRLFNKEISELTAMLPLDMTHYTAPELVHSFEYTRIYVIEQK